MNMGTTIIEGKNSDVMDRQIPNSLDMEAFPKLGYSFKEAQKITGIGRTTLWKAMEEGRLKCFKVGRRRIFSLSHLEEFLKLYESNGGAKPSKRRAERNSK